MNNVMLAAMVGGWQILLILGVLGLAAIAALVGGIVFLAARLARRGQIPKTGQPHSQTSPQPSPTIPPAAAICPRCGAPLPANSPQGLCPRCVMGVGLATQTEATDGVGPHGTKVIKPPPAPDEIGKHFPQLEILECLGRGGMGVVYRARQPKLNRIVALKILAPEREAEPKFAERFLREAQTLARLNHPNIVTVHDFGETDGFCYLLMEFVDGLNLRQMMREGRMKPEEALAIVPRICEALQFAHEQGIVHRDIKPENVLLDKQGRVKIADFGIAKLVGAAPLPVGEGPGVPKATERVGLTQDQVLGTPYYMAPEQVEHPQTVDHRADIYSLGVVFYEMLTGELPLGKFQPPSKKVQIDVRLDEVVLRALEKQPELRYQQASVLKTQVETISSTPQSRSGRRDQAQTSPPGVLHGAGSESHGLLISPAAGNRTWILRRAVLAGLIVGFLTVGYEIIYSLTRPDTYWTAAYVRVSEILPTSVAEPEQRFGSVDDPYRLSEEQNLIQSEQVLAPVIQDLKLAERWGPRYGGKEKLSKAEALQLLHASVFPRCEDKDNSRIRIGVNSESPNLARDLANAVADSYANYWAEQRSELKKRMEKEGAPQSHASRTYIFVEERAPLPLRPNGWNWSAALLTGAFKGTILCCLAALVTSVVAWGWRRFAAILPQSTGDKAAASATRSGWWRRHLMPDDTAARLAQLSCFGVALVVLVMGILKLATLELLPHELLFGAVLVLILSAVMVVLGLLAGSARSPSSPGAAGSAAPTGDGSKAIPIAAKVGFAWIVLFLSILGWFGVGAFLGKDLKSALREIPILQFGLVAAIVSTVCGWLAVHKIRKSRGKLRGLGLALFEGLLFPLLVLDVVINAFGALIYQAFGWMARNTAIAQYHEAIIVIDEILILLAWVVVDYLIIRWAWRAANRPLAYANSRTAANLRVKP